MAQATLSVHGVGVSPHTYSLPHLGSVMKVDTLRWSVQVCPQPSSWHVLEEHPSVVGMDEGKIVGAYEGKLSLVWTLAIKGVVSKTRRSAFAMIGIPVYGFRTSGTREPFRQMEPLQRSFRRLVETIEG